MTEERRAHGPETSDSAQDREYSEALQEAEQEYQQNESSLAQVRRKRVTSRAVMIALGIIAVCLAVGGLITPQLVYAREASRFEEIAAEANSAALQAESTAALRDAEGLLLRLRGDEAVQLSQQIRGLSESPSDLLDEDFVAALEPQLTTLEGAAPSDKSRKNDAYLAKRALDARELEQPDPKSWFDVDGKQLIELAGITAEEGERTDLGGTVTLERVQHAIRASETNNKLLADAQTGLEQVADSNAALHEAVDTISDKLTAESRRVAAEALERASEGPTDVLVDPALPPGAAADPATTADTLRSETTKLRSAAEATIFVTNDKGKIRGLAEGAEIPKGAVRIPGGEAVRIAYLLPRLSAVLEADALHAEAQQLEAEEQRLAEELRIAEELQQSMQQSVIPEQSEQSDGGSGDEDEGDEESNTDETSERGIDSRSSRETSSDTGQSGSASSDAE